MEDNALTISKEPPELKSMQYEMLRELALRHIQELAGKQWTDYNSHDPGVTMLEVLSYALTDLGYRTSFDIRDLLAREHPDDPDPQNFYTAANILPNRSLTIQDYRKLMIDVEVVDEESEDCRYAGVKNAWLENSDRAEEKIFVNSKESRLSLDEIPGKNGFFVETLYDVLLEFGACKKFGDLNESTLEEDFILYDPDDEALEGLRIHLEIKFPTWDNPNVDWDDPASVRKMIRSIQISIENQPDNYTLTWEITNFNKIILKGNKSSGGTTSAIPGMVKIIEELNESLYHPDEGLLARYIEKVDKIFEIVEAMKARLHANRNLCEDFFRFRAVRVEEIIVCADIEIAPSADAEAVEAHIFHIISSFLSPSVYFYTLEEMRNKCREAPQFPVTEINRARQIITIEGIEKEIPSKGDIITVLGLGNSPQEFTVHCINENPDQVNQFDLEVTEEISESNLADDAYLIKDTFDETDCLTIDQIFEGPLLKHGFIDDEELAAADRKKVVRVSDLIQLIMDVEGVIAVKDIQIANRPQNNDFDIESKSVRWCLELAFEHNYVPRLNIEDSKITYFKDQLPFITDDAEVESRMEVLSKNERPQKIRYPKLDLSVPDGNFRNPADYTSVQEEFPLIYGIGSEGIPGLDKLTADEKKERKIQVAQLKGYLLLFDQFLGNYLAQLANVKHLFTMQEKVDEAEINKTYYSQSLTNIVPDGMSLYRDPADHSETLQHITENTPLFEQRRNKFLDHLLARLAETFGDYAMLAAKVSGSKAPRELIDDKLKFLGSYPELSSGRGQAINYRNTCKIWHVDNVAGLDKRGELLLGMAPKKSSALVFRYPFKVNELPDETFEVVIEDGTSTVVMRVGQTFESAGEAKTRVERIIVAGVFKRNFEVRPTDGGRFHFVLTCEDDTIATSKKTDYTSDAPGGDADIAINQIVEDCKAELYENPEANRKNLTCPLKNYITHEISVDMSPAPDDPPTFTINYTLYKKAFDFTGGQELLTGSVTHNAEAGDTEAQVQKKAEAVVHEVLWDLLNHGVHRSRYFFDEDSSSYLFIIRNRRGEVIARSVENNFNATLADKINADAPLALTVESSSENDGEYEITNANADGSTITLATNPAPSPPVFDGYLMMYGSYDVSFIEKSAGHIVLKETDSEIFEGDTVRLMDTEQSDGFYTVQSIRYQDDNIYLKVLEALSGDETGGKLQKAYAMTGITDDAFVIKGGKDEQAVAKAVDFIREKFFSHEGFHVLEHLLLRPRTDGLLFVDITEPVLDDMIDPLGTLIFWKATKVLKADAEANTFTVAGDIEAQVAGGMIRIEDSSFNDGSYKIQEITEQDGDSVIEVKTDDEEPTVLLDWADDTESYEGGTLYFNKKTSIDSMTASAHEIIVSDNDTADLTQDSIVEITGSDEQKNNGRYKVSFVEEESGQVTITIYKAEQWGKDRLLPIHLDQDCESCKITDPYSHVVSVVVPYWQGRFINMDFRKFVEKRLRLEAPAHVLLNICWINCDHMGEFEEKYKKWLVAVNTPGAGPEDVSGALSELIDILTRMRNVYPTGTLHDCEEDDTLEEAIILNNSILGTF